MPKPVPNVTDEEDELWDQLYDTDAMRCCSCPACNHYLPPGEYKPDAACEVISLILRIVDMRVEAAHA